MFEILFFVGFLAFYYTVQIRICVGSGGHAVHMDCVILVQWQGAPDLTQSRVCLTTFLELVEFRDAGITFYAADFWASWDLGIIAVGIAFFIARMIGIATDNTRATDIAFDILSVEALFLVPR